MKTLLHLNDSNLPWVSPNKQLKCLSLSFSLVRTIATQFRIRRRRHFCELLINLQLSHSGGRCKCLIFVFLQCCCAEHGEMQIRGMLKGLYRIFIFSILSRPLNFSVSTVCLFVLLAYSPSLPLRAGSHGLPEPPLSLSSSWSRLSWIIHLNIHFSQHSPHHTSFLLRFSFHARSRSFRYFSWQLILTTRKFPFGGWMVAANNQGEGGSQS